MFRLKTFRSLPENVESILTVDMAEESDMKLTSIKHLYYIRKYRYHFLSSHRFTSFIFVQRYIYRTQRTVQFSRVTR